MKLRSITIAFAALLPMAAFAGENEATQSQSNDSPMPPQSQVYDQSTDNSQNATPSDSSAPSGASSSSSSSGGSSADQSMSGPSSPSSQDPADSSTNSPSTT